MAEIDIDFSSSSSLNFPSNTNKSKMENKEDKKEEKKIDKVVTGDIKIKKKGFFRRFKGSMVSEDANSVGDYVVKDIVIPAVKDVVFDAIRGALEMILWGSTSGRRGRKNIPYNSLKDGGTYQYNGMSNSNRKEREPRRSRSDDFFNVSEVMLETRRDAENVLESLRMVLEEYPAVTIADFYDTLGQSAPHTANKYGWKNLNDADIRHCKDGYYIDFPTPRLID